MMLVFPIITFPHVSRILGPSNLGCIYFAQSYGYYFINLANFGITSYAVREVSKVRDDRTKVEKVSNEIFNLNFLFSVISTVIYFIGVFLVPNFKENAVIFAIYSVVILTDFLALDWLLQSFDDYFYSTVRNFVIRLTAVVMVYTLIKKPEDYLIYTVIISMMEVGIRVPTLIYCRRRYARLKIRERYMNFREHIKSMFTLFSFRLVRGISVNLDKIMLGFMLVYANVGLYSTGVKFVVMIQPVVETAGVVLFPKINISADASNEEYSRNINLNYDLILLMGIPMAVGLFLISRSLVPLFAGGQFMEAVTVSRIMSAMILLGPIGDLLGSKILLIYKKDRWLLYCSVITAVSNVVLNLVLIPLWGINGAAVASIASCMVSVVSRYILARKLFRLNLFSGSLFKYTLFVLPFILIYVLFRKQIDESALWMFGFVAFCIVIYIAELLISKDELAAMIIAKTFRKGKKA